MLTSGFGSGAKFVFKLFRLFFTCFDDIVKNNHKVFINFKVFYWQIKKKKKRVLAVVPLLKPLATTVKQM